MELKRAIEIFEYNKDMLTCDMSIGRDPEHQDVSPDYYGKDAEDLYNAIVCVEKYIKRSIPIEWIDKFMNRFSTPEGVSGDEYALIHYMLCEWEKENEAN